MKPLTLYLIGDCTGDEFAHALAALPAGVDVRYFASADAAITAAHDTSPATFPQAEVIVIGQHRPGEVSASAVERLHATFPLARLLMLLGAWCEGEMRTGHPVAGVSRIFWHAFPWQIARLCSDLQRGGAPQWAFPRIAGESQRVLHELPVGPMQPVDDRPGALLIRATDLTTFETLATTFDREGYTPIWLDPTRLARYAKATAIVWDSPLLDSVEWDQLARCRHRFAAEPMLLLTGFPRADDRTTAANLGVETVLGKPYLAADLSMAVERMIDRSRVDVAVPRRAAG